MHPTATVPTDQQALQECGSFSQGATCLVEFRTDVGLQAHLIGVKRGPVDETFMMSEKQHRPLLLRQMTDSFSDDAVLIDVALVTGLPINISASILRIAEHVIDGSVGRSDPTKLMAVSEGRHDAQGVLGEGQLLRAEPQPD